MRKAILTAALLIPLITGCTANDPTFGGAVKSNYAMQVVNPDPHYEDALTEGGDGERSAAAVERYRTGKVKPPKAIRTTQGSGNGGGNGSGSGIN
jgi:type IV pilus biogenesis protein CpaD/CtpE